MNNNYDVFYFDNFLERYAALKGKDLLYLRSYGWNNTTDIEAINESYTVYQSILPADMWNALKQSEHVFVEVDDLNDTLDFVETSFPQSQATTTTQANYIYWCLVNKEGQIIGNNE